MQGLQRLTGSVLVRSWRLTPAVATATRSMAVSAPLSGKVGEEVESRAKPTKKGKADSTHPFATNENPGRLRPAGSNSEEAIAADRSDIDPLSEVKKKRSPGGMSKSTAGAEQASVKSNGAKGKAPSLIEVDDEEDLVRGGPAAGP